MQKDETNALRSLEPYEKYCEDNTVIPIIATLLNKLYCKRFTKPLNRDSSITKVVVFITINKAYKGSTYGYIQQTS